MGKTLDEANGVFYMGKNLSHIPTIEEAIAEKKSKEQQEKFEQEARRLYLEAEKKKQEEINSKVEKIELLPMGNKMLISKYPQNPYRKVVDGNVIVDYQGEFMNPETGQQDKQEELVACAKVIEVGPECKYVKKGDDVYFDTRTTYPVPFMSMGYLSTSEPQIICILNEGLTERFAK